MLYSGGARGRAAQQVDAWDLWGPGERTGNSDGQSVTGICARVAELVTAALWAEDAGDSWARASGLLGNPDAAIEALGSAALDPAARHGLVQRLGGVGGLIVVACEELTPRTDEIEAGAGESRSVGAGKELRELLRRLLVGFPNMSKEELDELLAGIEEADGFDPRQELAWDRRWLNVTYAVAARDGTEEAHRIYLEALDRVLASTRSLVVS